MNHLVLLGDSVFDNAAYVAGGPDVLSHVQRLLPGSWSASLAAVDGSLLEDIPRQLDTLPRHVTHLVLSAGGNDALDHMPVLSQATTSMTDALNRLAALQDEFEHNYRLMLKRVLSLSLPLTASTIYYPRFPNPVFRRQAMTALTLYNDAIVRVAAEHGVPLLDMRLICTSPLDYANPIEPSVQGGGKIAEAVVHVVQHHAYSRGETVIYGGSEPHAT